MTAMVDEFNEQSADIEVEFMIFKGEEYYTKLLAAMTSDSAPTVAVNHITRVKEYVTDDLLEPLDKLAEAQQVDWTDFTQKLQVASVVDGVHYCMPIDTHLLLMHYNVDEFKNMGLLAEDSTVQVPKGEEAFFEFFEGVKAKMDGGKMAISGTSSNGLPMYLWSTLLAQYGGSICERGTADDIFYHAKHEYTKGLLRSIPNVNNSKERLIPISGTPINLLNMPKGCAFCSRCDKAMKICLEQKPEELSISDTHKASCWMNVKEMLEKQAGGAQA